MIVKCTDYLLMPTHQLCFPHKFTLKSSDVAPLYRIGKQKQLCSVVFCVSCLSQETLLTFDIGYEKASLNWSVGNSAPKPYPGKRKQFPANVDTIYSSTNYSPIEWNRPSPSSSWTNGRYQSERVLAYLQLLDLSRMSLAKCLKNASGLREEDVTNLFMTLSRLKFTRVQVKSMLSKFPPLVKIKGSQVEEYLEFYTKLGFSSCIVVSLFAKRPALLACNLQKASKVIDFLLSMGIEKDDLNAILSRRPHILELDVRLLGNTVSALMKSGFSQHDITRLFKRAPAVFSPLDDDIQNILDFWFSLGVEGKYLCRALLRRPNLLNYDTKSMMRTYNYLHLWIDAADLLKLVSRFAELLTYDPETKLKPLINYFLQLGLPEKDIGKVILRRPQLMSCTISRLDTTVAYLKTLGVRDDMFGKVLTISPQVFTLNSKGKLKRGVNFFRSIGLDQERDMEFIFSRNAQIFCCSIEKNLKPTIDFFLSTGLDKDVLAKMIVLFPSMLGQNVEQSLAPKYNFLVDEMKRPVHELVEFPQYFGYSLEGRIKPRHKILSERGLYRSLASMLACTDDDFYKRYVVPYNVSSQVMGIPEMQDGLRKRATLKKRQSTKKAQPALSVKVSMISNEDSPSCLHDQELTPEGNKNETGPFEQVLVSDVTQLEDSDAEQAEEYPALFTRYYKNLSPRGIWIHVYEFES